MIIDNKALEAVRDSVLFYPCSGNDLQLPVKCFSEVCTGFWFVDTAYFSHELPEQVPPCLLPSDGYILEQVRIHFPDLEPDEWKTDRRYDYQPPPIRTEFYRHRDTGRRIRVNRHRRRGPSALRKQFSELGIFFYRGDSEEGSGTLWLTVREWHRQKKRNRWLIFEVLDKLIDGGLLVTDGSQCKGEHNPYASLARLRGNTTVTERDAIEAMTPFQDEEGREFRCVGCLGQHYHYGPTMVWQVRKRR